MSNNFKEWKTREDVSWKGSTEGWTKTFASKNLWRVPPYFELEDLLQEGYLCFHTINQKYTDVSPQNFMGLYKQAFINRINDLSKDMQKERKLMEAIQHAVELVGYKNLVN